jgi:hypothetical protein
MGPGSLFGNQKFEPGALCNIMAFLAPPPALLFPAISLSGE